MHQNHYLATLASVAAIGGSLAAPAAFAKTATPGTANTTSHTRPQGIGHTPPTPAMMQAILTKRLDAAVAAGTLTSAQEIAALAEAATVEQQFVQNETLPKSERQAADQTLKTQVESWAIANGISLKNVLLMHHAMTMGNPPAGK